MRIEIRGRNIEVTDELEDAIHKRFKRVGKQVSELATLDVELSEEANPRITDRYIAEATLHLKGKTIRAHEALARDAPLDPRAGRGRPPPGEEEPRAPPRPRAHPARAGPAAQRPRLSPVRPGFAVRLRL